MVFNEGAPSTLRKAQKQGCHLVSVLWIDECKKLGKIVSEADHPPIDLHLYDKPGTYRVGVVFLLSQYYILLLCFDCVTNIEILFPRN